MKRVVGLVATVIVVALMVTHPAAASVSVVAYFTRNPAASPPAGGIEVANAPDGIVSSGAIRAAENGADISSATVNLPEMTVTRPPAPPAGVPATDPGAILLRACPAVGDFKAGKGTLAEAPKANCDAASVPLTRDGTGTWSADVTALMSGPSPAIAIVPAKGAGSFDITFKAPSLDVQMKATSGTSAAGSSFDAGEFGGSSGASSSTSSGSSSGSSSSDVSSAPSGSSSFSGSSSSGSSSGRSSFVGGTFESGSFSAVPIDAAAAAGAVVPQVNAAPALESGESSLPTRRRLTGQTTSSSRGSSGQFLFFVVTAAVIGTGAGFARNRLVTSRTA